MQTDKPANDSGADNASDNRTPAMTGGAAEKEKSKPSPSGEEAMPGGKPNTPTTPG